MQANFIHYDLSLIRPSFDSALTGLVMELEHLRRKRLDGTTPKRMFDQLKRIFHRLESIGSARIEGNNTTVAEYMETRIEGLPQGSPSASIQEIVNIEEAMTFVEDVLQERSISQHFLAQLHQLLMRDLPVGHGAEGDVSPGQYRRHNVRIAQSCHIPPESLQVQAYMDELFAFIEAEHPAQFDLIKVALAHHRFVWIHPYGNGNGRTVRVLTYALLLKYGFDVSIAGRIVNPTAIFCNDRTEYYEALAKADSGTEEGLEAWCAYVLSGLKDEIEKVDRLSDYAYLKERVLYPALDHCLERQSLTKEESDILRMAIDKVVIQNRDIKPLFPGKSAAAVTHRINDLLARQLLEHSLESSRRYCLRFDNSILLRGITFALGREGFLPQDTVG